MWMLQMFFDQWNAVLCTDGEFILCRFISVRILRAQQPGIRDQRCGSVLSPSKRKSNRNSRISTYRANIRPHASATTATSLN